MYSRSPIGHALHTGWSKVVDSDHSVLIWNLLNHMPSAVWVLYLDYVVDSLNHVSRSSPGILHEILAGWEPRNRHDTITVMDTWPARDLSAWDSWVSILAATMKLMPADDAHAMHFWLTDVLDDYPTQSEALAMLP